jgi:hypothetical protein
MPGHVRVFANSRLNEARAWVSAQHNRIRHGRRV